MYDKIKITYLLNSGFALEMDDCAMIFDYYRDDNNVVPQILENKKETYFFVSHSHFDHFNPIISKFSAKATRYFISYDVRKNLPPKEKTSVLNVYSSYLNPSIYVKSFDSTDIGICFYIEKNGWKIFHAGDFNWWHWKDDTETNIAFARNGFKKQLKRLEGLNADIAFFPVDSRLEEFCDLGAREFCAHTKIRNLIAMHNAGKGKWSVPDDFPRRTEMQSVWIPENSGETHVITR